MEKVLDYLLHLPALTLWLIFLAENLSITILVLSVSKFFYKGNYSYSAREWLISGITNVLNTVVTYAGYQMWAKGMISISTEISWMIITDLLVLFFAMDLLMFCFHYVIHKTFLYKAVHQLHHGSVDPTPLDLFILHPVEALGFGSLWLLLLMVATFNIYAIIIYLILNVIFGLMGHLGTDPLPQWRVFKYLGTSTFHHDHHQHIHYNFGFYTSIWDRIAGTYKEH
jgi:Delta7-sterol 5-desaturase